ncbi:hypothetical protein DV735_g2326, partial [Chaetothyriales sp. CBS 134920]
MASQEQEDEGEKGQGERPAAELISRGERFQPPKPFFDSSLILSRLLIALPLSPSYFRDKRSDPVSRAFYIRFSPKPTVRHPSSQLSRWPEGPPRAFPTGADRQAQAIECRNCALRFNGGPPDDDMAANNNKTATPKVPVVLPKKDDTTSWATHMSHAEALRAVIGSKVRVFTNFFPQQPVEGYLHTADDTFNWIILWHPTAFNDSPVSSFASTTPTTIPTARTPFPPAQGGIKVILFSHIQSFTILSLPTEPVEPADLPQAPLRIDPNAGQQRLAHNIAQAQAAEARRGPKGTSPSDQALFEAISRILPARWEGNLMVISDQYAIEKPYKASNVRLVDEHGGVGRSGLDRIKTMVDMERQKILLRMGADVTEATAAAPAGATAKGG